MRGIREIRCIGLQGRKTARTRRTNQIFPVYLKQYILNSVGFPVTLDRMLSGLEFQAIPFDCRMLLLESSAGYPGANRSRQGRFAGQPKLPYGSALISADLSEASSELIRGIGYVRSIAYRMPFYPPRGFAVSC